MTLEKYNPVYIKGYLYIYYLTHKLNDGWCYETDLYVISDNGKNLKLIADENVTIDFLVIPDFDDNILQIERNSFQFLRTDIKKVFAWRVVPMQYRLKDTEFKQTY